MAVEMEVFVWLVFCVMLLLLVNCLIAVALFCELLQEILQFLHSFTADIIVYLKHQTEMN